MTPMSLDVGQQTAAPTQTVPATHVVFDAFRRTMEMVAADPQAGRRLALADTVLHVHVVDAPGDLVMSLRFGAPVEVVPSAHGTPEVRLFVTTSDIHRFWTRQMHLAMAIARGEIDYEGPVRKILRIVPVVRRFCDEYAAIVDAHAAAELAAA